MDLTGVSPITGQLFQPWALLRLLFGFWIDPDLIGIVSVPNGFETDPFQDIRPAPLFPGDNVFFSHLSEGTMEAAISTPFTTERLDKHPFLKLVLHYTQGLVMGNHSCSTCAAVIAT
jgi:hypothetical protein